MRTCEDGGWRMKDAGSAELLLTGNGTGSFELGRLPEIDAG